MKYKLIKEYPGSPKLGTILEKDDGAYYILDDDSKLSFTELDHYPYTYPEFWEEVVEKDYEILSFKNIGNNLIYDEYQGIYRNNTSIRQIGYCLKFYKIHSVKRLSDGAVFTVGEKVKFQGISCSDISHISRIIIEKNCLYICSAICQFPIKFIEKIKQPLFTTEDGVDIYHPSKFWILKNNKSQWDWLFETETSQFINYDYHKIIGDKSNKTGIYFSTKEKAEEYILLNKPCLSVNEIMKIFNITEKSSTYPGMLKILVKSKI